MYNVRHLYHLSDGAHYFLDRIRIVVQVGALRGEWADNDNVTVGTGWLAADQRGPDSRPGANLWGRGSTADLQQHGYASLRDEWNSLLADCRDNRSFTNGRRRRAAQREKEMVSLTGAYNGCHPLRDARAGPACSRVQPLSYSSPPYPTTAPSASRSANRPPA